MEPTTEKKTLTPEELEAARAARIQQEKESAAARRPEMLKEVDALIAYLQANREHIAGVGVVTVAFEDSILVDPATGKAANGDVRFNALHQGYSKIVKVSVRQLADKIGAPNPFTAMMLGDR